MVPWQVMLLPAPRWYYLLTATQMNKAASKCLRSFLADTKVILTAVGGCWNLPKAARKKDCCVTFLCKTTKGNDKNICNMVRPGTLFQVEFSLMYPLQLARIKMVLQEKLDCWNARVADAYLVFYIITHSRERPGAWIFKNVCLSSIKIHTNWYSSSEIADPFKGCTLTLTSIKYSLPFSATKCALI